MNNMFRKIFILSTIVMLTFFSFNNYFTIQALATDSTVIISNSKISPKADIIDWRYKIVNGKLYKREFNYSKNEWIGDWVLIP